MPSKKPRLQTIVETETYNKIKKLCEKEVRSESQLLNIIITQYINSYEKEHGPIQIESEK